MRTFQCFLISMLWWISLNALALDINAGPMPLRLTDNAITIGGRTLQLPAGDWTLVAEKKGQVTLDEVPNAHISTVSLVWVKEKKLVANAIMTLPVSSIYGSEDMQWTGNICEQAKDFVLRETFNSGYRNPACLLAYEHVDHLKSNDPLIVSTRQWLTDEGIEARPPFHYVSYSKQGDRDYGVIDILFPEKSVEVSVQVTVWANSLHEALRRFFERRDNQATLPAPPIRP